MKNLLFR
jgi:U3 small nucleolar RNA-associated protein 14